MAAITETVPSLESPRYDDKDKSTKEGTSSHSGSFIDEKAGNKPVDLHELALETDIGEVFDGPRLIDLGEDGKERPIGILPFLLVSCSPRLMLQHSYR